MINKKIFLCGILQKYSHVLSSIPIETIKTDFSLTTEQIEQLINSLNTDVRLISNTKNVLRFDKPGLVDEILKITRQGEFYIGDRTKWLTLLDSYKKSKDFKWTMFWTVSAALIGSLVGCFIMLYFNKS